MIKKEIKNILMLCVGSLGIVYGDIGTSPLYAFNEIYSATTDHLSDNSVLGSVSLIFWVLTLVIAFKYIIFVLQADNQGEGGVFALFGLFKSSGKTVSPVLMTLLILSAGFLFGDGLITPAVSILAAVEGLNNITTAFSPYIVPIAVLILTGLFFIQKKGSVKLGKIFGPVTILWFLVIGILGLVQIINSPGILRAINPLAAIDFLLATDFVHILKILGGVMLVITGGEALYADMGHFGKLPIRISWLFVVYPALLLNYFGQGAFILSKQEVLNHNVFYSMVPHVFLYPVIILATFATIIASQALISGVFSLSMQAVSLGLFPHLKIKHTHRDYIGQIYVPMVNWTLYFGCLILVLIFKSSGNLTAAYGFAVSGSMLITSIAIYRLAIIHWEWKAIYAFLLFVPLIAIDIIFFISNSLKIFAGGYIPLSIGIVILFIVKTWEWGKRHIRASFLEYPSMKLSELIDIKKNSAQTIPRTAIIMTPQVINDLDDKIPPLQQILFERSGLLAQNIIFMTISVKREAHVYDNKYEIKKFFKDDLKGSVTAIKLNFGYMEELKVESLFQEIVKKQEISIDLDKHKWLFHIMYERIRVGKLRGLFNKIRYRFFKFLSRNMYRSDHYFGLGRKHPLSIEMLTVNIK